MASHERVVVAGLLALFVCRAILANAIVPPWQGPDEPGHFALAYWMTLPIAAEDQVRKDVLQSMVNHRWWALYDDPPPTPLVPEIAYGIGWGTLSQPLYYGVAATALFVSRPSTLEAAYYHLRALSVVLAILTLACGWAGTRLLFGPEVAAGALAIAALHPQFLLASISVNADALVNFWGGFVWWQAARAMARRRRALSIALMLVGAVAALFTKRIGMILVGVALIVAVAPALLDRAWRLTRRDALLMTAVGVLIVATVLILGFLFREQASLLRVYWGEAFTPNTALSGVRSSEPLRFVRMTIDYFWLIAGWLRFQPAASWLWVSRLLVVGGLIGAVTALVTDRTERRPLAVAWLFAIVTLATVFWLAPGAPQARYLFPAFVPITVLLYVGLRRLVPSRYETQGAAAIVVLLLMLDATGFTTVHLATYIP